MSNKVKILIAEDEMLVAKNLQKNLEDFGFEIVSTTCSGEETILKAIETKPQLLLMDIRLEGDIDGIEAAGLINHRMDIPIVYLTAYADENTIQRAKQTNPYGYLIKPFDPIELRTTIEMALNKHQLESKSRDRQEWLETILDGVGHGIIVTNEKGAVSFMNPVAEFMTGWKYEEAFGRDLIDVLKILHEDTRKMVEQPSIQALGEKNIVRQSYRTILCGKDGKEFLVDYCASFIRDIENNIIGIVLDLNEIGRGIINTGIEKAPSNDGS
ncbi:MAG: response regulator [candidate division Zixibacteria bacterium]|nr:response regulator [candidate division Zixibacteria bacterium]